MKNESGRSMVEMLGVLAIIGVLSVAGIAGYTMAMNKYRANEIVNVCSQLAILAQARYETTGATATVTGTNAGYTGNVGGIAASSITAQATGPAAGTISTTATVDDTIKNQIGAATGNCTIGGFDLANSLCTS